MYATYPHRKNSLQSILENKKEKSLEFELKVELFHCEVEMSCLSNAPVQHSQPASVIKTDNDPNSATSLIFQLKPAAWFQPQTKRLVAGGEMEACHTVFLLFFFFIIIVLFFTFLSAPSDGFRSKASISLLLSFFSAMFWLHKSIYDDLSRRRKERRTFSPPKNWSSTCISNYGHATWGNIWETNWHPWREGFLRAAASVTVEFYSTCFEI